MDMPPANVVPAGVKIKPPREGTEAGCLSLVQFLPAMEQWLKIFKYWPVMEYPEDHDYATLSAAEKEKDEQALYHLLQQLSPARRVSVTECEHASELWRVLVQVSLSCVIRDPFTHL